MRLVTPILTKLVSIFLVLIVLVSWLVRSGSERSALDLATESARTNREQAREVLSGTLKVAQQLAQTIAAMKESGVTDRKSYQAIIRRSLAQRSAMAARETADKIVESIERSNRGVLLSDQVATSLDLIVQRIRQVDQLVVEVAASASEQQTGITQVTQAMHQMDQATQKNAALAEESAASSNVLNSEASSLNSILDQLTTLIRGSATAARATQAIAAIRQTSSIKRSNSSARLTSAMSDFSVGHNSGGNALSGRLAYNPSEGRRSRSGSLHSA